MYSEKALNRFKNPKYAGEMEDADGVGEVGNVRCLLPSEKLHINNTITDFRSLSKSDKILSHDGKYHNFSAIYKRAYNGKVITIKNKLGKTTMTTEHLVHAIKVPKKRKYLDTKVKKTLVPAWYHVDDLEKRDVVLYPIFSEIIDKKYLNVNLSKAKYDFNSKEIPKKIKLDADFLRLCGYFLAEGHANVKTCRNSVKLCFNINEKDYVEDVKNITKNVFGLRASVVEDVKKNTAVVIINNVFVAKLFKYLFGVGAKNKKIPDFMMLLPPEKQKHLILGLWRGDGYLSLKRVWPRVGYATISEDLAHQMKLLLMRQKIVPSIYYEDERNKDGVHHEAAYRIHIGDRTSMIKLLDILGIKFMNSKKQKDHSWFDDSYFYTPISGYEVGNYKGQVCNLEVPETHSFTTNSLLVHNCGDVMRIYIKVEDNVIVDIKFLTYGCVAAITASDVLCELVKGKTLDEAMKITDKDITKELDDLPTVKLHCSLLGTEALKAAIEDYRKKSKTA